MGQDENAGQCIVALEELCYCFGSEKEVRELELH